MLATRRNLMAAIAVLPAAVCPAPAFTAVPSSADADWTRLYAAYRSAEAEEKACCRIFGAREDAWDAGNALREPEPQPLESPPFDMSLPLAEALAAAIGPDWEERWEAREGERKAWKVRDDAAYAAFIGDTEARWEAADAVCDKALKALLAHPVVSLSALAEKAQVITERFGDMVDGDDAKVLIADIRRLAGGEA